jgi:hypothetical protein
MTADDLTPAQREEIQSCWLRQYLGRKNRAMWDREYRRERYTGLVRARIYRKRATGGVRR